MTSESDVRLAQAWDALGKGQLEEAERLFELLSSGASAAEGAFGRGTVAAARGDFPRAADLLAECCRLDPSKAIHHYQLGVALVATGRVDGASKAFREAVAIDQDLGQAWFNLGNSERAAGRIETACEAFLRAANCSSPIESARLAIVRTLRDAGRLEDAVAAAREAIGTREDWSEAWSELGLCLARNSDLRTARTCFEQAVEIDPRNLDARFHLGVTAGLLGDLQEAEDIYRSIIEHDPNHVRSRVHLAALLMQQSRLDAAEHELMTAAKRPGPDGPVLMVAMADLRMRQARPSDAERIYREASRHLPNDPRARLGLVASLIAIDRADDALRELDQFEQIAPGRPETLEGRSQALGALGRHEESRQVIEQAIALHGQSARRLWLLGRSLKGLDLIPEARQAFEAAAAADPGFDAAADELDRLRGD
jgi:tetratricopeptide (TPR) repeat protein